MILDKWKKKAADIGIPPGEAEKFFKAMDKNGDDIVTEDEFQNLIGVSEKEVLDRILDEFALLFACSSAALVKKTKLDVNQKAYIQGSAVLGDGAGQGNLNTCMELADHFVADPNAPEVKVCGTGINALPVICLPGYGKRC